ncbi:MAG: RNA polymerase sporulation sigma factor SigG [Clostridiales bacterium]|nr:RNA polymerase sporulation sigma factor SigG [Clostridiales bacterium]
MYYNKVEICGINTSTLKTLTEEQKEALLEKVAQGDMKARKELIDGNLRLVLSVIQRFGGRGESADDLFQIGCVGLIKAIDNFDMSVGVKFSTYAVPMIIGEIRRYLRDNSMLRVSRGTRDLAYKALSAKEALAKRLSHDPTVEEISAEIGENVSDVSAALEAIVAPVSIYDPVYSDGGDSIYLLDQISDSSSADENWIENIALAEALKKLSEREKSIISMRFYKGKTQMEIADEIGISQAQVSRIEKNALDRIKKQL